MLWFDLDNTPHVPLFSPILKELKKRNLEFVLTARDFAQTKDLLKLYGLEHILVGGHAGRSKVKKVVNLFHRAYLLRSTIRRKYVKLAVSHGSRSQLLAAKSLGIRSLLMLDYEYTEARIFNALATKLLIPIYIPEKRLREAGFNLSKVVRYNGFKEELYLNNFEPDPDFREKLRVSNEKVLVVIRPPSMSSNYHDSKSEELLLAGLRYFSHFPGAVCIVVNRTEIEKRFVLNNILEGSNVKFLEKPVNGLQLLYSADIAISGGGTMNRESALLGTETYSIFTGKRPYLDEYLQEQERLKFIETASDYEKIKVERKYKKSRYKGNADLVNEVTDIIMNLSN